MQKTLEKNKLSFLIIPTRFCPPDYQHILQEAYAVWKDVWSKTFSEEMGIEEEIISDNFFKHTHVSILFYDNKIACVTTMHHLNLSAPSTWDDSYFKVWPEITRFKLQKENKKVIACCNFSLTKDFRGRAFDISWKDFMLALNIRYLKTTDYDCMLGEVRLEKGMGGAAYRTCAQALAKDVPYLIEGRKIDIVRWSKTINESDIDPIIQGLVNHIWKNSVAIIDYGSPLIKIGVKNAA